MKKLILVGAGGHCKSCIDIVKKTGEYNIVGLIDLKEKIGETVLGYPIIDCDENLQLHINKTNYFLITLGQIGAPKRRKELFEFLVSHNANLPTIISPAACVSKHSSLGRGVIVMHNAFVNSGAVVGDNCIINSGAIIEHDAVVGNHCHISTSCVVNGGVQIGDEVFIGSNATVVQYTQIPGGSFVKAASLVK